MPRFNENCVVIRDCTVVWDGMNRPQAGHDGAPRYSLKIVVPPNSPDLAEFHQLAQEALQRSKFNGILPAGGRMPVGQAGPLEFGGMFPGFGVISAKTKFVPQVHAEDVSTLEPMQWSPLVYVGQRVNILVDCYEYDNMGNKGIGAGLQGVQIITSAGAQRLALGGSGPDTSSAFGGQPAAPAAQPGPYAPPGAQPMPPPVQAAPPVQGGYAPVPAAPTPMPPPAPVYGTPVGQTPAPVQVQSPQIGGPVGQHPVQPVYGTPAGAPVGQTPSAPVPPATTGYAQPVAPATGAPQQQGFIPPGQQ